MNGCEQVHSKKRTFARTLIPTLLDANYLYKLRELAVFFIAIMIMLLYRGQEDSTPPSSTPVRFDI